MKEIRTIQAVLDFIIATSSNIVFLASVLAFLLGNHDAALFGILVAIFTRLCAG